jgi:hypothetical protein
MLPYNLHIPDALLQPVLYTLARSALWKERYHQCASLAKRLNAASMHAQDQTARSESDIMLPSNVAMAKLWGHHSNSKLSRTHFRTRFLNSGVLSRHSDAASTFAGDSSFGLESIEMTDRRMVSGV